MIESEKFPEGQIIILFLSHQGNVIVTMVIITNEMENPVNYDPVELIIKLSSVLDGILTDRIDTYEKISIKFVTLTIIKSNYVGKIVVTEITLVDIEDIVI